MRTATEVMFFSAFITDVKNSWRTQAPLNFSLSLTPLMSNRIGMSLYYLWRAAAGLRCVWAACSVKRRIRRGREDRTTHQPSFMDQALKELTQQRRIEI